MFGVRSWPHRETGDRSPAGVGPNCPDIGRPAEKQFCWASQTREAGHDYSEDIQRYADAIMAMIKEDQDTGQVPRNVCSWDELDDSVDAGDYFRLARMPTGTPEAIALRNAVNEEVGRRLASARGDRGGSLSG
jgi:hypothetical protein